MKLCYSLVLAGILALTVSAKADRDCKFAVNQLTKSLKFPALPENSGSKLDTSAIQTVIALARMHISINRLSKGLVDTCSNMINDVKKDQYLRLDYLRALETIKDTYVNIWAASKHTMDDVNVHNAVESVLEDLDPVVDFIYTWSGTLKYNEFKRLVNDVIRLRIYTKAAIL